MNNHIAAFVFVSLAAVLPVSGQQPAAVAPAPATNRDAVVARVGSAVIQRRELDMAMAGVLAQIKRQNQPVTPSQIPQLEHEVLNSLVDREIVLQSTRANPPAGLDEKVKEQLERARAMAGGEEPLLKSLEEAGISRAELERRTRENVIWSETLRQVAESQTKVTPEEVKAFYDANTSRIKQPEMVRASHILVRVEPAASEDIKKACRTKINAARSLVIGGEKFDEIARKVSDDPQSARTGGDLGFFQRGSMVPEFDKAAFSLATNQVSEVITTQFGYHVLMVTDRKPEKQLSLEEKSPNLERMMRQQKSGEVIRQYIKGLREKAKVEILLPPLPAPAANTPPAAAPKS